MERISSSDGQWRLKTSYPEVGPWAKEKLEALGRYLDFYTKVLKNQHWQTLYLDAYAGGGRAYIRPEHEPEQLTVNLFGADDGERELIDGSPRVALGIDNPFSSYIFVDPNSRRIKQLKSLKAEMNGARTIEILHATASDGVDWIVSQSISRRSHRGIAFLDPFGTELEWLSVKKLANTKLFEVVVNFALSMAIIRILPNSGEMTESSKVKLDSYFGNSAWFDEVYKREQAGLFASNGFEKRSDYPMRLLKLYCSQLKEAFGYVSTPRLIRNTRGSPLYYLIWAGPHKKGLEGADHILTMGERLISRPSKRAYR